MAICEAMNEHSLQPSSPTMIIGKANPAVSGTLIALDSVLEAAMKTPGTVDIYGTVYKMQEATALTVCLC